MTDRGTTDRGADSKLFSEVTHELLEQGLIVRFQACGSSMSPAIRDGEVVQVTPVIVSKLRKDDIVLTKSNCGFRLHRLVAADHAKDVFITRGDCGLQDDPPLSGKQIVGIAVAKEVRVGTKTVRAKLSGIMGRVLCGLARGQRVAGRWLKRGTTSRAGRNAGAHLGALGLLFVLLASSYSHAQVLVDATTSSQAALTGTGTRTLTFNHTTTTTPNRCIASWRIDEHRKQQRHCSDRSDVQRHGADLDRRPQRRGRHTPRRDVVSAGASERELILSW